MTDKRNRAAVALAVFVPWPSLGVWAALAGAPGPIGQVLYTVSKIALVAVPAIWLLVVDRGRPSWSPLRDLRGIWVGAGVGILFAAIMLFGFLLVGEAWIDEAMVKESARRSGIDDVALFTLLAAYLVLVNPLLEEYAWRWFVQSRLTTLISPVWAVPASAGLFTLHHVLLLGLQFPVIVTLVGSAAVFCAGTAWSWMTRRYSSIWPAVVSHAVVDAVVVALAIRLVFG